MAAWHPTRFTAAHPTTSTPTKEEVAAHLAKRPERRPGPLCLAAWRRAVGLNRPTFARLARLSERTLATYEKHAHLPTAVQAQTTGAVRLVGARLEIIPAGALLSWLQTPNPGFDGRAPRTLIEAGERDPLWEMIHQTRHGAFA